MLVATVRMGKFARINCVNLVKTCVKISWSNLQNKKLNVVHKTIKHLVEVRIVQILKVNKLILVVKVT